MTPHTHSWVDIGPSVLQCVKCGRIKKVNNTSVTGIVVPCEQLSMNHEWMKLTVIDRGAYCINCYKIEL